MLHQNELEFKVSSKITCLEVKTLYGNRLRIQDSTKIRIFITGKEIKDDHKLYEHSLRPEGEVLQAICAVNQAKVFQLRQKDSDVTYLKVKDSELVVGAKEGNLIEFWYKNVSETNGFLIHVLSGMIVEIKDALI